MTQSEKPTLMQMMKDIHAEALDPTQGQPHVLTGMIDKMMDATQDYSDELVEILESIGGEVILLHTENEELKDENERLRADLKGLTESRDIWANRAVENRENAARYRWLVTNDHPSISVSWSGPVAGQGYSLTDVIDAAMKGKL